jgi:hypothetical protein
MEAATIAAISAATVNILLPLLKGGAKELSKGAASEVGKSIGSTAVSKAKELYDVVKAKFNSSPVAAESLDDVTNNPDDPDTQAAFRNQLKKLLAADDSFAALIAGLTGEVGKARVNTNFSTNVHGDVENLLNVGTVEGNFSIGGGAHDKE